MLYRAQSQCRRSARHAARDVTSSLSPSPIVPTFCYHQMFDDNDTINFVPQDRNIKYKVLFIHNVLAKKTQLFIEYKLFGDSYRTKGFRLF